MNEMNPKREQAGYAVTAFLDRVMAIPGMRERIEAAIRNRKEAEQWQNRGEPTPVVTDAPSAPLNLFAG